MRTLRTLLGATAMVACVVAANAGQADAAADDLLGPTAAVETVGSAAADTGGQPAPVSLVTASVDRAQTGITVRFLAADASPCLGTGRRWFTATVTLTRTAGTVVVLEHYAGPPGVLPAGAQCMRSLNAKAHRVELVLPAPLGTRWLTTADGHAIPVTRA